MALSLVKRYKLVKQRCLVKARSDLFGHIHIDKVYH
jgi:hypothetical protein